MVTRQINTPRQPVAALVIRQPKPQIHFVDGRLALGDCADCGQTVYFDESLLRVAEGKYVCESCIDGHCVSCGQEAVAENRHGEPVCVECRVLGARRSDQAFVDAQFAFYEERPVMGHATVDLNEGRFLDDVCCLDCREEVRATVGIASPFEFYFVSVDCDECGAELITYDAFSGVLR